MIYFDRETQLICNTPSVSQPSTQPVIVSIVVPVVTCVFDDCAEAWSCGVWQNVKQTQSVLLTRQCRLPFEPCYIAGTQKVMYCRRRPNLPLGYTSHSMTTLIQTCRCLSRDPPCCSSHLPSIWDRAGFTPDFRFLVVVPRSLSGPNLRFCFEVGLKLCFMSGTEPILSEERNISRFFSVNTSNLKHLSPIKMWPIAFAMKSPHTIYVIYIYIYIYIYISWYTDSLILF